jgi:hypothetical protein
VIPLKSLFCTHSNKAFVGSLPVYLIASPAHAAFAENKSATAKITAHQDLDGLKLEHALFIEMTS